MQTDPNPNTGPGFDPATARLTSLNATLSRVRLHRRVRRTGLTGLILAASILTARLIIPSPALRPDSPPPVAAFPPWRVRTAPLTAEQKIVTVNAPGLYLRTRPDSHAVARLTTPRGSKVPRLGENEFRALLAKHDLFLIQLYGGAPELKSLRPE